MRRLSPETHRKLILSVGTQKTVRPLSPIEVADALTAEVEAGAQLDELASACHLEDHTMVTRFLRLLKLSPTVRHLVGWGRGQASLSFTVASQIARLPLVDDQEALCSAVLEHGLSSGEVQEVLQTMNRGKVGVTQAVQPVLRLRRQVERQNVFLGAVVSVALRQHLRGMSQTQRNDFLKSTVSQRWPELPPWGGSLGIDRFSLVGGAKFAEYLDALPGGFEKQLNDLLQQEVLGRDGTPN